MLIYVSHKYGNNEENKQIIENIIKKLQLKDTNNTYVSPIHTFGFMYSDVDYDIGIKMCLDLLSVCQKLIVASELSKGVELEINYAKKNKIPIEYLE